MCCAPKPVNSSRTGPVERRRTGDHGPDEGQVARLCRSDAVEGVEHRRHGGDQLDPLPLQQIEHRLGLEARVQVDRRAADQAGQDRHGQPVGVEERQDAQDAFRAIFARLQARSCKALATRLRCVSMTALGDAVVPPVGASRATSSSGISRGFRLRGWARTSVIEPVDVRLFAQAERAPCAADARRGRASPSTAPSARPATRQPRAPAGRGRGHP